MKINEIEAVIAVAIKGGYQVLAVDAQGNQEIIKKKSTRLPKMVQLYKGHMNGNYQGDGIAKHFTFSQSIDSWYKESHIKSFKVGGES